MDDDEKYVQRWLTTPSSRANWHRPRFQVKEFSKEEKRRSKTPDFRVY